jgi:hypothetical protein
MSLYLLYLAPFTRYLELILGQPRVGLRPGGHGKVTFPRLAIPG